MPKHLITTLLCSSSLLISGCTTLCACGSPNIPLYSDLHSNVAKLQYRTWHLSSIPKHTIKAPTSQLPALEFTPDGTLTGSDGCNRLIGRYQAGASLFRIGQITASQRACLYGDGTTEKFNNSLDQVQKYQSFGSTLKLLDQHGNVLMEFYAKP